MLCELIHLLSVCCWGCPAALDMTGCFQWLALHLTRMSKGNGLALFLLYYTLSSILTIFTSNDVSIMALTVSTL